MIRALPPRVRIVEVGPRDGLQNEATPIPTPEKIAFIDALSAAGLPEIEATSFVAPGRIPQLTDAEEVMRGITRRPGCHYTVLVPNEKGLERALAVEVSRIAVFTAASESFNRKNIRASIAESIERYRPVVRGAQAAGLSLRGYVSTAFACPYEGPIAPTAVREVVARLRDLGVEEISLGDTVGVAVPSEVDRLLDALEGTLPLADTALHLHDTRGTALSNVMRGLERGVAIFDASAGGLGGCPYAPGAGGNLATEDLLYLLERLGIETGVDLDRVRHAGDRLESLLGHALPSKVRAAGGALRPQGPIDA
ncbi:MAG: hydroxymethylglutaryl-CoA lyase [Candidatus Eisenbacteria bacterium]|nr:hydroxymethylglutaryl-CoA lyase [Candidatus Eisenbacteria bacterium]